MWLIWIVFYYAVKNDYIIPSFSDTMVSLGSCLISVRFWAAFGNTLLRTLIAFLLSFVLAGAFAALSSLSAVFEKTVKPVMVFIRTLPTLAVALILLIWTTPRVAPAAITFLVLFPMIYAQLLSSIGEIDGGLKEMAQVYRISKRDRLFKIYLPHVSVTAFSQAGANISLGLKVMISAEVIANTAASLGGMMQSARSFLEVPELAALTLLSVALGFVFEISFGQLKRITAGWNG